MPFSTCENTKYVMVMTRYEDLTVIHVVHIPVCTHQQFPSGYNQLFFSCRVVGGVWCSNRKGKSEHQEGPHFFDDKLRPLSDFS